MKTRKTTDNLLYEDLTYQIRGAIYSVRSSFGTGHKESVYVRALGEELTSRIIPFQREVSIPVYSPKTGKSVGLYRPDFVVDNRVILEVKAKPLIPKFVIDQLYDYLRNSKYELGFFINFSAPKVYIRRVIFTNDRKPFLGICGHPCS